VVTVSGVKSIDARLHRFVLAHLLTVVGEWAATIGVLVHAYGWGGSSAVGIVSLAVLAPPIVCAPLAAGLTARYRAHTVRVVGFAAQVVAYAGAALASFRDLPALAIAAVVVGIGAINTLRPTGAVLLPVVARSTPELVVGNLRVSYCDGASALVGPLFASLLAGVGGSTAVFVGCAVLSALSFGSTVWKPAPLARARVVGNIASPQRAIRLAIAELRERPWAMGVLGVSAARNVLVGAFDVLLVIVALRVLKLGDRGPGLLSALLGGGAVLGTLVVTVVVRRARLRWAMLGALAATSALCALLGFVTNSLTVFAALPFLGICLSMMDALSRMLLQRSTSPRSLGPLFGFIGFFGGLTQLVGAGIVQVALAMSGTRAALAAVAVVIGCLVIASARALRTADANADIPVVEMSLLANVPMFAPLPATMLEMVARASERVTVATGEEVIRQGDMGDVFYVVVEGEFDISMNGVYLRTAPRGDFFGEVALLSNVPRTATVAARGSGVLLAIHRDPFLMAISGHEASHAAAHAYVTGLDLEEKMRWTRRAARELSAEK
jgi:MFS family permease